MEAEDKHIDKSRNNDCKADKPNCLFTERSCVDAQDAEQTEEDYGEDESDPDNDNGVAGIVTPEGHLRIAGETESGCAPGEIV
ncbi:MAG: hypothetical protein ACXWW2_04430 [Candidatus Deferrimicrobiaceae bacterium]